MKFLVLILRNMRRQLRRTILTIAVATLVFAMLVSVPTSMDRIINLVAKDQRLFVSNRAGPWNIPAKYCRDVEKMPHVEACVAELDDYMVYRSDSDWIPVAAADTPIIDMTSGPSSNSAGVARFKADKRSAAVGFEAMKRYGWHVGQQVMLRNTYQGKLVQMPFIIQGVVPDQTFPNVFLIRRDYFADTYKSVGLDTLEGIATRLIVRVDTADNLGQVARVIDETYRNADAETRSQSEQDFVANGLANVGNIRAIILSLVVVVLITVLLISGSSMAMTCAIGYRKWPCCGRWASADGGSVICYLAKR
jgi:putative ABC transport system permease protein